MLDECRKTFNTEMDAIKLDISQKLESIHLDLFTIEEGKEIYLNTYLTIFSNSNSFFENDLDLFSHEYNRDVNHELSHFLKNAKKYKDVDIVFDVVSKIPLFASEDKDNLYNSISKQFKIENISSNLMERTKNRAQKRSKKKYQSEDRKKRSWPQRSKKKSTKNNRDSPKILTIEKKNDMFNIELANFKDRLEYLSAFHIPEYHIGELIQDLHLFEDCIKIYLMFKSHSFIPIMSRTFDISIDELEKINERAIDLELPQNPKELLNCISDFALESKKIIFKIIGSKTFFEHFDKIRQEIQYFEVVSNHSAHQYAPEGTLERFRSYLNSSSRPSNAKDKNALEMIEIIGAEWERFYSDNPFLFSAPITYPQTFDTLPTSITEALLDLKLKIKDSLEALRGNECMLENKLVKALEKKCDEISIDHIIYENKFDSSIYPLALSNEEAKFILFYLIQKDFERMFEDESFLEMIDNTLDYLLDVESEPYDEFYKEQCFLYLCNRRDMAITILQ